MKKKWLSVLLAATMVSGNAVSTTSVFAMDDFSDAVQETETSEEPEEENEDFVDVNLADQEEQVDQEEDESSTDVGTDTEEEESFSSDNAGTSEASLFDDGSAQEEVAFQSAAEGEVELPDYIFSSTWNKWYDVLYHEKDKTYLYKGQPVVFKDGDTVQVGETEYNIRNVETEVTVTVGEDNKVSVSLSNLSNPVYQISGQWNSSYAGTIQTVYKTDISGLEEVRTSAKGNLTDAMDLGILQDGTYHLTGGFIYEAANQWSPGYDFGDGKGTVTARNFGYLPDITVKVGDNQEEEDAYLGVNAGSEVPDSFTNDLWTQYDYKELKIGDTAKLVPRRVEEAITNAISNDVQLPHFNYEIIKGDSVTLDETDNSKVTVTAVKEGNTVVKITYDALEHIGGKHFDAVDPVNTAYVVYSVGGNESITITDNIINKETDRKNEADVVFRSYDTMYFTEGDSTPFTLKASAEGAESIVVKCNGITVPQNGTEGTYTLPLENRSNIIEITAKAADGTTRSKFHVLDARKMKVNVENATHEGEELEAGDTAKISFTGITMPVYKLATIYNPQYNSPSWGSESTYVHYTYGSTEYKGHCSQWDLAIKNSFEVTFPEEGIFTFEDGGIHCQWWGSTLGADKTTDNPGEPNMGAPTLEDDFSFMPDFDVTVAKSTRINVDSVTLDKTELQIKEDDTAQLTATITPEEAADKAITWTSSNEEVAKVSDSGLVTAVAEGEAEIKATVGGKEAICKVTVTPEEVVINASVTSEKIHDGDEVTISLTGVKMPKEVAKEKNIWEQYTGYKTDIPGVENIKGDMETITFIVPEGTPSGTYTLNDGYYYADFGGARVQGYFIVGNTQKKFYEDKMPEIKVNIVNREEIKKLREEYNSQLDASVDYNNYREEEQEVIKDLIDTAKEKIATLETEEDMQAAVKKAQKQITAIKTADQYAEAELNAVKAEAKKDLDAYKNAKDYRDAQQKELSGIITKAKLNISEAASAEEVSKIMEEAKAEIDKLPTDKQLTDEENKKPVVAPVLNLRVKTTKTTASLTWNKVKSADGYKIYGTQCNGQQAKLIATVKAGSTTWNQKGLKKATHYKYQVVAYKNTNGKKVTLVKSDVMHAVTTGGKYGNAKKVTVNKAQVSVAAGKSFTLKVKVTNTTKNVKNHVSAVRYKSSNSGVATVSKKGVIKGIKKGACTVYCYAPNGVYKAVKVTVK